MSSLTSTIMASSDVSNHSVTDMVTTEKPLEEFAEVKIALLIDWVYRPVLLIVGLVFNSLCFVTFVFTSLRTTSTCVYMAAIAVLDSIVLFLAFCVLLSRAMGQATFYLHSSWTCGFQFFLFFFSIHLDVLVLLAMTVDRFIVVKFPLKAQSWSTPKSAIRVIAGLGVFAFALNFHVFFNRRLVRRGSDSAPLTCWYPAGDIEDFMEQIFTIIDASIYSFIPFVSLLTLNLLIIRQLRQAHKFSKQFTDNRDTDSNKESGSGSVRKSMTSTNINVMFLLVSFTFLLLTSPIVIMLLYGRNYWKPSTNAERAQFRLTRVMVNNIMYTNHAVNFLLYCISGRRFREELKTFLTRLCSRS